MIHRSNIRIFQSENQKVSMKELSNWHTQNVSRGSTKSTVTRTSGDFLITVSNCWQKPLKGLRKAINLMFGYKWKRKTWNETKRKMNRKSLVEAWKTNFETFNRSNLVDEFFGSNSWSLLRFWWRMKNFVNVFVVCGEWILFWIIFFSFFFVEKKVNTK